MKMETEEDVNAAIDFLERCAMNLLDASELRSRQLDNEHRPDVRRGLQAEIGILQARIGVVLSQREALKDLRLGARLSGPSPDAVRRLGELEAQVARQTNDAQRAAAVLGIANDIIALAGEVRELSAA